MISFRFHIVSITAAFLAMAIGVVVGSTYVDRAIVEGLQNRIDRVEGNLDRLRAENQDLERDLGLVDDFVATGADYAVTDRLTDVPVLLLALRGVEQDRVEQIALLAQRAGAEVPGVIWIEEKLLLDSEDDVDQLGEILGTSSGSVAVLQSAAWRGLFDEVALAQGGSTDDPGDGGSGGGLDGGSTTTTTTAPAASSPILDGLLGSGFLTVEPLDDNEVLPSDLAGRGRGVLMVTGAEAEESLVPLLPAVVETALDHELATVVADVYVERDDAPPRGEQLAQAFEEDVRAQLALIDHADLMQGDIAAVLALDAIADGVTGQFGYGPDAGAVLPRWSPP